jgi:glycosyltransferase involved in cell wall biosynthesis
MSPPRLLYLVTEDWYFVSHRLPMARAAREAGYEVHVACRTDKHRADIEREGFALHPLAWSRASRGRGLLAEVGAIRRLYARIRPDLVHQVAMKPVLIGSLASAWLGPPTVNSVAGLGSGFIAAGLVNRAKRLAMVGVMRAALNRRDTLTVVQNPDDLAGLRRMGVRPEKLRLVPGSGVDADVLRPLPEPEGPFTVGFAGRLLADKGVGPLIEAVASLRERLPGLRLLIAGTPDPTNSSSYGESEIARWRAMPGVELLGHVTYIAGFWARCHVAVLPSRREGLPKALLEAAALGRPLIATDVPGCREVARPGVNGLLVPVDDAPALARAIATLAEDPALRATLAAAGRRLVEETFSSERIGAMTAQVYRELAPGIAPSPANA